MWQRLYHKRILLFGRAASSHMVDGFHNNSRVSNVLLWCHMITTSMNTLLQYSDNICGSFTWNCWHLGPGRMGFFPVCDYIYTRSSFPGPQFCLKLIVPPFTVSFASSLWGLPSEPGTHYSPSWKQTLQSDASSTTWGFHSWKPL